MADLKRLADFPQDTNLMTNDQLEDEIRDAGFYSSEWSGKARRAKREDVRAEASKQSRALAGYVQNINNELSRRESH